MRPPNAGSYKDDHPSKYLKIQLEKSLYVAGDTVRGRVILSIPEAIKCKAIRFQYGGFEKTNWTEQRGGGKNTHPETHTQTIRFFGGQEILWGDSKQEILAGEYPFQITPFVLPSVLPPSFVSSNGWISYFVRAYINPFKSAYECVSIVKVNPMAFFPMTQPLPTMYKSQKRFGRSHKGLLLETYFENPVVRPGDVLTMRARIKNLHYKHSVKFVECKLIATIHYRAHQSSKDEKRSIAFKHGADGQKELVPPASLLIFPIELKLSEDLLLSFFPGQLITVNYKLRFKIATTDGVKTLEMHKLCVVPTTAVQTHQMFNASGDLKSLYVTSPDQLAWLGLIQGSSPPNWFPSLFEISEKATKVDLPSLEEPDLRVNAQASIAPPLKDDTLEVPYSPSGTIPKDSSDPHLIPLVKALITIRVLETNQLVGKSNEDSLEPYIKMILVSDNNFPTSKKYKTKVKKTSQPTWNETFEIPISDLEGETLWIKCWSHSILSRNYSLGETSIVLAQFPPGKDHDIWLDLKGENSAQVHVQFALRN